ncbi:MAG: (2Fe-2S)-binding protein [bacterium]
MKIEVKVNGEDQVFEIGPSEKLIKVLRREGYKGTKIGCDEGHCGSCTVLLDGEPVLGCLLFAGCADGHELTTIEGLGTQEEPHPLQTEFVDKGAVQCGYCIPGMLLSAKSLLDKNPDPDEEEIKRGLDGNYCRCTGYVKQVEATKSAAEKMRGVS